MGEVLEIREVMVRTGKNRYFGYRSNYQSTISRRCGRHTNLGIRFGWKVLRLLEFFLVVGWTS